MYCYPTQNYYQPMQQQYMQPQYQPQTQPQSQYGQQMSQPSLYGKVVDSIDVVKAIDQPIGMNGIYPKADMSAIYIKSWCADGTTKVDEFKKIITEPTKEVNFDEMFGNLTNQIEALSKKIDKIKAPSKKVVEVVDDDE